MTGVRRDCITFAFALKYSNSWITSKLERYHQVQHRSIFRKSTQNILPFTTQPTWIMVALLMKLGNF